MNSKREDSSRPNILWICTDQQRFDTLGCYGNRFVNTPHLDRLAANGVLFSHFFTQSPLCAPSRASFLTGRYPRTTGLRQNGTSIPASESPVTRVLADAGYVCGMVGKLHLGLGPAELRVKVTERRIDDGYVYFRWSPTSFPSWRDTTDHSRAADYEYWLREKGVEFELKPYKSSPYVDAGIEAKYHQTTWCAEQTIAFIEANAPFEDPWLISINPFDPPADYLERYLDRLKDIPLPNYMDGELEDKPFFQKACQKGAYNAPGNFSFEEMGDRPPAGKGRLLGDGGPHRRPGR